jgi:hypothetical protein
LGIFVFHGQAFLGAGFHAVPAGNTAQPVDPPFFFVLADVDRGGRALSLTNPAKNTIVDLDAYLAPGILKERPDHKRIISCCRSAEQAL